MGSFHFYTNAYSPFWITMGSFGLAAIAYLGERLGVYALSSVVTSWKELRLVALIVGGVGYAFGGLEER